MAVALVTVVSGDGYEAFARDLFSSAHRHFKPGGKVADCLRLTGRVGWPAATMYRYHVLLENERLLREFDHVFLIDADMRFEAPVGDEVLGRLVATLHPGYVEAYPTQMPFETRSASRAHIPAPFPTRYFCGGFVGGEWETFRKLATMIRGQIEIDAFNGITAVWHDESHLNSVLATMPPDVVLPPSYCYPDTDSWYLAQWTERYERKLVALDKTAAQRGTR